jgi:hypothetical protein
VRVFRIHKTMEMKGDTKKIIQLTIPTTFVEECGVGRIIRGRWGHLEGCSGSNLYASLHG